MTDTEALRAAARELRERPTGLPASLNPLLAQVFDQWARVGDLDPDLLHRVAGRETVALARALGGLAAAAAAAHVHRYERVASRRNGPDGEKVHLLQCDCGDDATEETP